MRPEGINRSSFYKGADGSLRCVDVSEDGKSVTCFPAKYGPNWDEDGKMYDDLFFTNAGATMLINAFAVWAVREVR